MRKKGYNLLCYSYNELMSGHCNNHSMFLRNCTTPLTVCCIGRIPLVQPDCWCVLEIIIIILNAIIYQIHFFYLNRLRSSFKINPFVRSFGCWLLPLPILGQVCSFIRFNCLNRFFRCKCVLLVIVRNNFIRLYLLYNFT